MVNDKIECYNWANKLEKLSRILVCGKNQLEKCMIINALAVSKLVFNAPTLQNSTTEFLRTACTKVLNI